MLQLIGVFMHSFPKSEWNCTRYTFRLLLIFWIIISNVNHGWKEERGGLRMRKGKLFSPFRSFYEFGSEPSNTINKSNFLLQQSICHSCHNPNNSLGQFIVNIPYKC
jgi:hypothetical protein